MIDTFNESLLKTEGRIMVVFKAPWCVPCKQFTPIIEQIKAEGFNVYAVNTDEDSDLTVKYGIRSVPTTIIFENGEQKQMITGVKPKADFIAALT